MDPTVKFVWNGPHIVMFGLHLLVTIIFVCWMIFKVYKPLKADASTPSTLTTYGILGTFAGIFLGLVPFISDIFTGSSDISANIPNLISGIAVAAICSITGMSLSILSKTFQRSQRESVTDKHHVGATADTLANLLEELIDESKKQNQSLALLQKSIIGDDEGTLITQIQKIRTSFSDKQDQLQRSFDSFAQNMAKSNSEALIEALKEVIKDFNTKINEQFGENFKQLNSAVGQLLEWQNTYKQDLIILQDQFSNCLQGINTSKEAIAHISNQAQAIVIAAQNLEELIKSFHFHKQQLENHLEAFSKLSLQAQNAFPIIHENLNKITESLLTTVENSIKKQEDVCNKHSIAVNEMFRSFEVIEAETREHTSQVFGSLNDNVISLSKNIESSLNKSSQTIQSLHTKSNEQISQIYRNLDSQISTLISHVDKVLNSTAENLKNTEVKSLENSDRIFKSMDEQIRKLTRAYPVSLEISSQAKPRYQ